MKTPKIILAALAALTLSSCGKETVIKEVLVTSPPVETTSAPVQEANKFDQYLVSMYDTAAQSREWSDGELLEFGAIVCDAFTAGSSLRDVLTIFEKYSTGSYDDEFFVAVIGNSVLYLCPEHLNYVQSQI